MLYILDVGVGDSINVRCEATCKSSANHWTIQHRIEKDVTTSSELVVDLLLEQKHRLFRKVVQKTK